MSRFNLQNELMLLQQKHGQSIAEYSFEAEALSKRVPKEMDSMLAIAFIRGLAEQESRRRVSYDLRDIPDYTFSKAVHLVKSWYQEIGVTDPFNANSVGLGNNQAAPAAPMYALPGKGMAVATKERMTSGPGQPSGSIQEAFNQMMVNFMDSMKADFRQSPHRTPGVTNAASGAVQVPGPEEKREISGRTGSSTVVCFNCGGTGHISTVCKNPPLSYAEQKRVRDESRAERDARVGASTNSGVNNRGSATTVERTQYRAQPAIPVRVVATTADLGLGGWITEIDPEDGNRQVSGNSVSCVRVVSVAPDKRIVGQACATLMRMPAVAAIFENAMVDKRVRVEDDDYELLGRSAKQPRTQGPTTRSSTTAGHGGRPQVSPQVMMDTSPEPDSDSEEDVPIVLRPAQPGERIEIPATREPQSTPMQQAERSTARPDNVTKGKHLARAEKSIPPINWMRGQKQYSLQDALNEVTPKISFPQLLDVCNNHSSYRVDRVPIDFHEYICVDT